MATAIGRIARRTETVNQRKQGGIARYGGWWKNGSNNGAARFFGASMKRKRGASMKKRKRGRPRKPASEHAVRVLITLPPDVDALALKIGAGNRSRGIQAALLAYKP
jgi:hypothetical protein